MTETAKEKESARKKVYFPNLNGLRFIAALMVLFPHIEQIKAMLNLDYSYRYFPYESGTLGVVLFFVLSGFLITYLLLEEKRQTKTIAVLDFYKRRILRIWPLYYLLVFLGFFVFPHIAFINISSESGIPDFSNNLLLFLFFMPNLAFGVPYISQAWSIGVEEQFYIIWPLLMKHVKNKYVLMGSVVALYLSCFLYLSNVTIESPFLKDLLHFVVWFKIDCMAIGGLFALLLFKKHKILDVLFAKPTQFGFYLLLAVLLLLKVKIPYVHFQVFAILFGLVILNLAGNSKTLVSINNNAFNFLGKISYGVYMYHPIIIVLTIKTMQRLEIENIVLQYVFSIGLTFAVSALSYRYFEGYFLKMKAGFSKIISGNEAKKSSING